ncbi:glycoside hydrolase family 125 protein [Hyaloscypha variabilis]
MGRLQQRRLKIAAIAVLFTLVFSYISFSGREGESITWDIPDPTPGPIRVSSSRLVSTAASAPALVKVVHSSSTVKAQQTFISELPAGIPIHVRPGGKRPPSATPSATPKTCMNYQQLQRLQQEPLSEGWRKFGYNRPAPECRTFNLTSMEKLIEKMKGKIKDPDLFRLFENTYPNTLDTMIKWKGYAKRLDAISGNETTTDEELTYVITGDIDAMWLRDSASQIYSYLPLLEASTKPDSLASLWRGLINIHARYIIISPYCHSFQPPPESGIRPTHNGAFGVNHPYPPYDPAQVFDCKWELDSLASFLQVSSAYYQRTGDLKFFQKYNWISAVKAAINAAGAMRLGTYSKDGKVEESAWTFTGYTNRGSETLTNDGLGNPTKANGMVRTAFRPSDDACIYQLLVPANMMWAKYLEDASFIMEKLEGAQAKNLTTEMRNQAFGIRQGIDRDAIVHHRDFGDIFAYEIDGFGGANLMDDANVPSLLAMPLWNYSVSAFKLPSPREGEKAKNYGEIYSNTRNFILSDSNPYYMHGPVISAVGGPHIGPGKAWPMAAIIRALTAFCSSPSPGGSSGRSQKMEIEDEIKGQIFMVLNSTAGTGVIHESVNSWNEHDYTRAWFGWANGLFGELIIKVAQEDEKAERKPGWLGESYQ